MNMITPHMILAVIVFIKLMLVDTEIISESQSYLKHNFNITFYKSRFGI